MNRALEVSKAPIHHFEYGDQQHRVIYRKVGTVNDAIGVKRDAWLRGNDCAVIGLQDGTFGTWEVCF